MTIFPSEEMALTHILVVSDIEVARDWYRDVLGASIYREYGGTSVVLDFQGAWLLLVTAGGPTEDKPDVHFVPPDNSNRVAHSMTIRVPDCRSAYTVLKERGAEFLTPLLARPGEIRCFFRDPDGHLFEISEST